MPSKKKSFLIIGACLISILLLVIIGLFIFIESMRWRCFEIQNFSRESCIIEVSLGKDILFQEKILPNEVTSKMVRISTESHYRIKFAFDSEEKEVEYSYDTPCSPSFFERTYYIVITPEKKFFISEIWKN